MKKILLAVLLAVTACNADQKDGYRLAADFDENDRIFIIFTTHDVIHDIIVTLSEYENVGVIVEDSLEVPSVDSLLRSKGAILTNITYFPMPQLDLWIRDQAPAIVVNRDGILRAVDFKTNQMGFQLDDQKIAKKLNIPLVRSKLLSVGGARESNGEGAIILMENYYKVKAKGKRKKQIEKELKEVCGINEVIWLKQGLLEDSQFSLGPIYQNIFPIGAGGHIDEFCRFVNHKTILLAQVPFTDLSKHYIYQVNNQRLEENYSILKAFEKTGYNVVRIPTAELIFDTIIDDAGMRREIVLMSSYMNFVIGNKVILAAKYFEEGKGESVREKDEAAKKILQDLFPNRTIVQINPQMLNYYGGGFHCMTWNLPKAVKKDDSN